MLEDVAENGHIVLLSFQKFGQGARVQIGDDHLFAMEAGFLRRLLVDVDAGNAISTPGKVLGHISGGAADF